ncbi:hypothetical protein RN001_001360 [Aquatica leii]|uniref:acylphosphatase n=1 Tax=Aquatica leii TaxID=1421715 RepID=A0AAN7SL66_9COLE|nr:hypothetical protein RN001_001360 [Aquatica leii]
MNTSKLLSVEYEVFGRVQGVYFRKFTQQESKKIGVRGWCMNTDRGTVSGVMEGEESKINHMKNWLKSVGSPSSKIEKADFKNEKMIPKFTFIPIGSVATIIKEGEIPAEDGKQKTPGKKRAHHHSTVTHLKDFEKPIIRNIIYNFHKTEHQRVTKKNLREKLCEDLGWNDDELQECAKWLQKYEEPWDLVVDNWKNTYPLRDIVNNSSSAEDYMK